MEEMPQSWSKIGDRYVSPHVSQPASQPSMPVNVESGNMDRIVDQVRKHAAINYSYYTRTK